MSVPKLRFKEFDGDWILASLNQLSSKIGDGIHATPKYDENGTIPFINGNNLVNGQIIINGNTKRINTEEFQKYNQILSDQTLFLSINGTIGNLAFYKNEQILLGKSVCFINLKNDIDKKFIYLLLQSPQLTKTFNSELTGTTIKNLSLATVRNSEFYYPREKEQTKIATFLSAVDEKISQLTQKHQLLSQYKQGMMQKLFSQKMRFKAEDGSEFGEWECIQANSIFENYSNKNHDGSLTILAATQDKGVVPRDEIDIDIKSSDASVLSYKIIEKGNFVISLRSFQGGIEYSNYEGICSPAYTVLKVIKPIDTGFYKAYLKTNDFIQRLSSTVIGIRDGKQISYQAFSTLMIDYPCLEEQTKIANFLSSIDQKIEVTSQQIEQAKQWKKGLLQQMFV